MTHDQAAWFAARLDELRAAAYAHDWNRVDALVDELGTAPDWLRRVAALATQVHAHEDLTDPRTDPDGADS